MSLGSLRLDPVVADVVSFFDEEDAVKFTLSSPKGYAIVDYYRAFTRSISNLRIDVIEDEIQIEYSDENKQQTIHCERGEINKVVKFLSTCQTVNNIRWNKLIISDDIIKELMHIRFGNMYMKSNRFDVNPRLAVKFLQKNVNTIGTESVEISNTLINDNNMKLFKNVDFHFSLNREKQSFENRVTNISDEYLRFNWENGIEKFELPGFLTGFTVKGIAEYAEKTKPYSDFGIISCDQLEEAVEAVPNINGGDFNFLLSSWNGQKMLSFQLDSTRDNDKLAVLLTENGQDISKIARFTARTLELFNEIIEVVKATCDEEKIESEQRVIESWLETWISYEKDYKESTRLRIAICDEILDQYFEVNRTDIDEGEAYLIVHKFLKMYCLNGELLTIYGFGDKVTIKKNTNDEHSGVTIPVNWPKNTMEADDETDDSDDSSDDFDEEEPDEMDEDETEEDSDIDEDNVN